MKLAALTLSAWASKTARPPLTSLRSAGAGQSLGPGRRVSAARGPYYIFKGPSFSFFSLSSFFFSFPFFSPFFLFLFSPSLSALVGFAVKVMNWRHLSYLSIWNRMRLFSIFICGIIELMLFITCCGRWITYRFCGRWIIYRFCGRWIIYNLLRQMNYLSVLRQMNYSSILRQMNYL